MLHWELLKEVFDATCLMSPREYLFYLKSESDEDGKKKARELNYDVVPIGNDEWFEKLWLSKDDKFVPITKDWIVSANTSIPDLFEIFVQTGKPALFVINGQKIVGIVTPADFNKIPARTYIYLLLANLEILLADLIRKILGHDEEVLAYLSKKEKDGIIKRYNAQKKENKEIDIVNMFTFGQVLKVACKSPVKDALKKKGISRICSLTDKINKLRNTIMHPVSHFFAVDKETYEVLKLVKNAVERLKTPPGR